MEQEKKYMDFEEFNKNDRKKVEIFNKFFTFGLTSISISAVGIGIAVFISAFIMIYALFYVFTPKDVLKSLIEEYRGEKFIIVEDFGAEDKKSRGVYLVSPQNEPNIIFKMYNTTQVRNDDDYSSHRLKYYFENCLNEDLKKNFYVKEETVEYDNIEFLHYSIFIKLDSYEQIEDKVRKIFDLKNYFLSQNDKMFEAIFIESNNLIYPLWINCDTEYTIDQEINKIRYQYINQLKENNSVSINQIDKDEILKIWKPKILNLYYNEKKLGIVEYNEVTQKYCILNLNNILTSFDNIKITKKNIKKVIKEIKYNNKKIKIVEEKTNNRNIMYEGMNLEDFCSLINAQVKYDYDEKKANINL